MIAIEINGTKIDVEENLSIKKLLEKIKYEGKMFVIEKNLEIIQKDQYETSTVHSGDKIEIVEFAGGG